MYQFLHTECYSNTASKSAREPKKGKSGKGSTAVRGIVGEATREEGYCDHVKNPEQPIYHYGQSLDLLENKCLEYAENSVDGRGQKLRKDALVLLSGVISAPADFPDFASFRADCVDYLKEKYGENLYSVIEHTDEACPHIHFYVTPEIGQRFENLCDGRRAAAEARKAGEKKGAQNTAYKNAMKSMQDDFYEKVAMKHGMLRIGPKKQRLTREEYKAQKAHAEHMKNMLVRVEALVSTAKTDVVQIKQTAKKEAVHIKAKAAKSVEIAEQKGFEAGLNKVEKMSWFKRLSSVFLRAVVERNDLKNELETLKAENTESAEKADTFLKRAKKYFKTAKSLEAKIKEIEPVANSAQRHKREATKLKNEVKELGDALALSRSRVQHLEAAYLKPEKSENSENITKNMGKVLDPTLSESRARQARYEAESYSM